MVSAGVPPAGVRGWPRSLSDLCSCNRTPESGATSPSAEPAPPCPSPRPARPRASTSRSACGCTTSTGATPTRRRCCWCTAAATTAATGTGWPRSCAATGTSSRPTCAATATASGRTDGTYTMSGYIYDLAQLIHQLGAGPGHHRRPLAGRQHRAALRRPLPRERRASWSPSRGWARRRKMMAERSQKTVRRAHARLDRRAARPLGPPAAPLCHHRGRLQAHAGGEQAPDRPSRRATSPQHGVNQNEDGTYSWKFDNYVRSWPPYDMTHGRHRGAVGAHRLPDAAGLRQGELGLQPGEGRPRTALQECRGRRRSTAPATGCTTTGSTTSSP